MIWRKFAFLTILLLTLTACGQSAPVEMADIPVPPQVTLLEAGQNAMADMMLEVFEQGLRDAATEEGMSISSIETALYAAQDTTSWTQIKDFYTSELNGAGWKLDATFTEETELFNTIGWMRGRGANEQGLFVIYTPDIFGGTGNLLIVMLVSQ